MNSRGVDETLILRDETRDWVHENETRFKILNDEIYREK